MTLSHHIRNAKSFQDQKAHGDLIWVLQWMLLFYQEAEAEGIGICALSLNSSSVSYKLELDKSFIFPKSLYVLGY